MVVIPVDLAAVSGVLGLRGGAEVGPSIVQAVMVDMVNEHTVGHFEDRAVHFEDDSLLADPLAGVAYGVERAPGADDVPFVLAEPVVIGRIDNGVPAPRQRYPAEGVAVTQPAIEQCGLYGQPVQPRRDFNTEMDDSWRTQGANLRLEDQGIRKWVSGMGFASK